MRKVEVCAYTETWKSMFAAEAEYLWAIYGDELIDLHHIGSTSVPALSAKPIIDMMPVAKEISRIDQYDEQMRRIGYEPKGEHGIPGRRFFRKGGNNRTHHVHIFQVGSPDIVRHLAFRDYLCAHPGARERYGQLKMELAQKYPTNISAYIDGKEQLVKEIEALALTWYETRDWT